MCTHSQLRKGALKRDCRFHYLFKFGKQATPLDGEQREDDLAGGAVCHITVERYGGVWLQC